MAEATYFSFQPDGGGEWEHNILGEWSKPNDVREGASKGLNYVGESGVKYTMKDSDEQLQIKSTDAGLIRWGDPLPFPTPLRGEVDLDNFGAAFNLHNNIWNTNYPDWFPFDDEGREAIVFRFDIEMKFAKNNKVAINGKF